MANTSPSSSALVLIVNTTKMGRRRQRRGDTKSQKKQKKRRQYLGFAPPVKAVNVKWDRRATLKQNYKRLGLLSSTGDIEAPMPKGELTKGAPRSFSSRSFGWAFD